MGRFINADVFTSTGQGILGNNMFAYCNNNPIIRTDSSGESWVISIGIGFIAGLVGQYVSDVINNINEGQTGMDALSVRSSLSDYVASGIGGAIAATPLKLFGTIAVGAAGSVVTDGLKGNINNCKDFWESASRGAVANMLGYGVAKVMAALKVSQINNMSRASRKLFLRNEIFCNSQANANKNIHMFSQNTIFQNMKLIEGKLYIFRSGIYSTITSTFAPMLGNEE